MTTSRLTIAGVVIAAMTVAAGTAALALSKVEGRALGEIEAQPKPAPLKVTVYKTPT